MPDRKDFGPVVDKAISPESRREVRPDPDNDIVGLGFAPTGDIFGYGQTHYFDVPRVGPIDATFTDMIPQDDNAKGQNPKGKK
jgi:hypothetical protein